jgi:opacity protein-like surface antigen
MKTFLILVALSFSQILFAEEGIHSVGLRGGQTLLSSDWGSPYGNALGAGLLYRYAASDWLEVELGYLNSKHSGTANGGNVGLSQNAFSVDVLYNIDTFDILVPYIKGGVEYVTHTQDVAGTSANLGNQSYNGFGLNIGAGGDFIISKKFAAGIDFTFHDIFTVQSSGFSGNGPVNVIGNYYTVMAHALFRFGAK